MKPVPARQGWPEPTLHRSGPKVSSACVNLCQNEDGPPGAASQKAQQVPQLCSRLRGNLHLRADRASRGYTSTTRPHALICNIAMLLCLFGTLDLSSNATESGGEPAEWADPQKQLYPREHELQRQLQTMAPGPPGIDPACPSTSMGCPLALGVCHCSRSGATLHTSWRAFAYWPSCMLGGGADVSGTCYGTEARCFGTDPRICCGEHLA